MPLEFSFLALSQILLTLFIVVGLWKSFSTLATFHITEARGLPTEAFDDYHDSIAMVRWKWLAFTIVGIFLLVFNPIDLDISEQANRTNTKNIRTQTQAKEILVPERVVVEKRSFEDALDKFSESVSETAEENAAKQNLPEQN